MLRAVCFAASLTMQLAFIDIRSFRLLQWTVKMPRMDRVRHGIASKTLATVRLLAAVGLVWAPQIWGSGAFAQVSPSARTVSVASNSSVVSEAIGSFEIPMLALDNTTSAPVVTALAASNEGRFLAAAGDDHAIRIVDVKSGETIRTLSGHIDWIQSLVFASASKTSASAAPVLYSAGNDGRVLEWKYDYPITSREVLQLPYAVRSISMSSDKQLLAIGGFSEEVLIWDLKKRSLKHRLYCDCGDQRCVRFSPNGERLLCSGREGEIRVWDTETGEQLSEYRLHRGRITTAAFSADGTIVTSAGEDRQLVRFDLSRGAMQWRREIGLSKIMSMCLVNESLVAVAGADNKIRLFDALADEVVAEIEGHTGSVAVMVPCGQFLASGSFDTTVRIWDLEVVVGSESRVIRPVLHAPLDMDSDLRIR